MTGRLYMTLAVNSVVLFRFTNDISTYIGLRYMTKRVRTKIELIEFFSMQMLILYVMKEHKLKATRHSLTPDPARSEGEGWQAFVFKQDILISIDFG